MLDLHERYGGAEHDDEVMTHVEWLRLGGRVSAFGLPLVKWSSKERLDQLIAEHNEVHTFATLAVYLAGLRSRLTLTPAVAVRRANLQPAHVRVGGWRHEADR